MTRHRTILLLCLAAWFLLAVPTAPRAAAAEGAGTLSPFVDEYFHAYFIWNPSEGTLAGLHQYDAQLEDRSAAAVAKRIKTAKAQLARLEEIRQGKLGKLTEDETIDAEVLDGRLRAELLDLETLRTWRKNPMHYVSTPSEAIDALIKRRFAPAGSRLGSVIARLKATPALFDALRANIDNPPREFTDLSINIAEGSISFFRETLRDWARGAAGKNAQQFKEFDAANDAAVKSLEQLVLWLKKDLLPRSKGSYMLGADNFARKLLYEDMVDIPADRLLQIGEAALRRDQKAVVEFARKVDPTKTPAQVMDLLKEDHPTEDDLIPAARRTIEKCRQFLIDKRIIAIPSEVRPTVTETPLYHRYGSGASMDAPGAYETKATEAFYYVTPTEKHWDAKHKKEHLMAFNHWVMQTTTIHEAFPGHFIQFLYAKQYPTKTRKLTYCDSNVEGWAHYTEQMTIEEGYGDHHPKIHLAQLSDALLRDCRFVVSVKMHTQGMTVEQGTEFFKKEGYQEHAMAYEEARRGAYDPTYLVYTLGKLQIYKLREDYKKLKGADYTLQAFHNEFVKQGGIPIKLIRRIMLPGDKGPAL
jgi:uncharacterized protein (DUF885 family)